jgi:foldase protein PrsA
VNNSKKLRTKKVKKDRLVEQKPITKISKPWIITSAILVVILIGALLFDEFYESTILTMDGDKFHESDLSYYFYSTEAQYGSYNSMFGTSWDTPFDESGATLRDYAREGAVDSAVYTEILYREAKAEDYALTDEEKETVATNVDSLLKEQMTKEIIDEYDFTKKNLTNVISKSTLADRYRQDKIDSFDIDDQAIKDGISKDDYRQYDIQYLFVSTQTTDDEGNTVAVNDEEKTAAYDKISSVYDKAKTTEDWSTLVPEDEEQLIYRDTYFLESGDDFTEDFEKSMKTMENGAISEIFEDEKGYYIVRMVNNNSTESYDTAVEDAITEEENTQFDKYYEELQAKHKYDINESALKKVEIG